MTRRDHLVYLGGAPTALVELLGSDTVGPEVTVTTVQSVEAAVEALRRSRANCVVVDEATPACDLDAVEDRLRATQPTPAVAVRTEADRPAVGDDLDPVTLRPSASPAERWERLRGLLDDAPEPRLGATRTGGETDDDAVGVEAEAGETAASFTDTLQWHPRDRADDDVAADVLADSLAATPTVVETFLDNIVDVFFVIDLELNFRLWNDSINDVTGYSDDELATLTPMDIIVEDHHERALAGVRTIVEEGQATAEFDIETSDGSVVPFSFTGSLIEGERPYIAGIGRDISERKARETELRRERDLTDRVIETSPVGIIVLDADGEMLRTNRRATKLFEMTESELQSYLSDGTFDLYDETGEPIPREDHPVVRALETRDPVYGSKHHVELPDGEMKWVSKNAAPLLDEAGGVSKVVLAVEDVTELKERERELAQRTTELDEAVAELRRSNAELERFAYVASHDLKEPLRMISNYVGLLDRRYGDELDEDARDFIDYATEGAQRMQDLINSLLKYSRTHRHADDFEAVDSEAVVATVRSNLEVAIDEADAEVRVGSLPTVHGDRNHLVQLFQNLLSNAITYSGESPPTIDICCECEDDSYRFAVADDGPGIAAEDPEQVFEIFYSGADSDSTGIGLAICKKIVENHGGRIWAEADPDSGTTIYFTIPATIEATDRDSSPAPTPE
jgi:PAS domain S-box-containing protein